MEEVYSIVLEDQKKLSDLCGSNDSNLHYIEKLLESHIYTVGNEIYFCKIIERLQKYTEKGHILRLYLIKGIYSSICMNDEDSQLYEEQGKKSFEELEIIIPSSSKRIYPRNKSQISLVSNMLKKDIVFAAGIGKIFLAVARALSDILGKRKLVLTRSIAEAGENLGFLLGDLVQKINPYLRPLNDAMEALISCDMIAKREDTRSIEIAPLAYMRGRSISNSFIILDEAQNTTKEQMKMFLTRIAEYSKAVITGDIIQIDLPQKKQSGLIHAIDMLKAIPKIGFTFFNIGDVIRNPLIKKNIEAYENEK